MNWLALLPHFCLNCSAPCESMDLCLKCRDDLPWTLEEFACLPYEKATALFDYREPIDDWIKQLKFSRKLYIAKLLGLLLSEQLDRDWSAVVAIPLHKKRLQKRGYNQAEEIAQFVAQTLKLPLIQPCIRNKATQRQTDLNKKDRANNVIEAFECERIDFCNRLLIIDDVASTGSTLKAFGEALKQQNPNVQLDAWVIAHGFDRKN